MQHARLLLRAERLVAKISLASMMRRALLMALAGLIAMFGLVMLNAAAFLALDVMLGHVWAALAVAGADFGLASLAVGMAMLSRAGRELKLARDLRDAALAG